MGKTNTFFNKSSFRVSTLLNDPTIKPDVAFSLPLVIKDITGNSTASSVTSKVYSKDGRNLTELATTPQWSEPLPVDEQLPLEDSTAALTFQIVKADKYGNLQSTASVVFVDTNSKAYYKVVAVDNNRIPIKTQPEGTIDIQFLNQGATENTDYEVETTSPEIDTVFYSKALDEGDTFTASLVGNYSNADNYSSIVYTEDKVTTTIATTTRPVGKDMWLYNDTIPSSVWDGSTDLSLEVTIVSDTKVTHSYSLTLYKG